MAGAAFVRKEGGRFRMVEHGENGVPRRVLDPKGLPKDQGGWTTEEEAFKAVSTHNREAGGSGLVVRRGG